MKSNEFKEIIRRLVIEELKKELPREVAREVVREVHNQLPKLLFEMLGQKDKFLQQKPHSVVNENISPDPNELPTTKKSQPHMGSQISNPQKKTIKKYAKDPVLNQILNEITPGLPSSTYSESEIPLPTFDKIGALDEFKPETKNIITESTDTSMEVTSTVESAPSGPDLSRLFNKNFSAILKKSKEGHGGNFSGVIQNW